MGDETWDPSPGGMRPTAHTIYTTLATQRASAGVPALGPSPPGPLPAEGISRVEALAHLLAGPHHPLLSAEGSHGTTGQAPPWSARGGAWTP